MGHKTLNLEPKEALNVDYYKVSKNPKKDIERFSYQGQPAEKKQFRDYNRYLEQLPKIYDTDMVSLRMAKLDLTRTVLEDLTIELEKDNFDIPTPGNFARTIIAIEMPTFYGDKFKEGAELVVAHWGKGFESPIHGHAPGYMHEEVLQGKFLVNMYRLVGKKVRPYESYIKGKGVFVSQYAPKDPSNRFMRQTLIHNFKALEPTNSLHYLPEHTRDGRDNGFEVERFGDNLSNTDVTQLSLKKALKLKIGDVAIVRSSNVPEYGDHYIVITGGLIKKEHGFRQEERVIAAPETSKFLDTFEPIDGLTILKLNKEAKQRFLDFHGIKVENRVIFPNCK